MADTPTRKKSPERAPQKRGFVGFLKHRHDPLTSLLLTIPIFLLYHLGILLIQLRNGVDLVSGLTFELLEHSLLGYVGLTLGYAAAIAGAAWWLRRKGKIRPTEWLPVLGESVVLALLMSFTVGWATHQLFDWQAGPPAMNPLEKLVMAAGAGFHEELVFRVGLFAGGTWALHRGLKMKEWKAALIAGLVSSVIFSGIHYVGSFGDPFRLDSFFFRALAGVYLAVVYRFRGFAVAVYTHTIYDLIVFFLR
ncbi:MAG: CPBP family glutamic-type intramembrane protease [Sandaracinaceae bacterium]